MENENYLPWKVDYDDIKSYAKNHLKVDKLIQESFHYITNTMKPSKKMKLSEVKFIEGKSYDWCYILVDGIKFLVRQYGTSFTIYYKKERTTISDEISGAKCFGVFIVSTDSDKLSGNESDARCDNPFMDIDELFKPIVALIAKGDNFLLWNSVALPRPDHVKIEVAITSREIDDVKLAMFALEEISLVHRNYFAVNEMLNKIKEFKIGDRLSAYEITGIQTDDKGADNHYSGLELQNTNFPESEPEFQDVISLTEWYYDYVFNPETV